MRAPLCRAVALVAVTVAACSGGGRGAVSSPADTAACPLFVQLDRVGDAVAQADVKDPEGFRRTLDAAVAQYARTARRLRAVVPGRLRNDVDRLQAAVEQYRFRDAATARAALDGYAASRCGIRRAAATPVSQ